MLHAALETILRVLDVAEVFVLPSELEPRGMVARLRSTLKVAERGAGVMWYELRVYTGRRAHRAHMDCFGDMRRYRTWGRRGDADDERERNVDEFLQLGIVDLGRSHCWISRCGVGARVQLLRPIDEGEDVSAPDDLAHGVSVRTLDGRLLHGEGDKCW